MSLEGRTRTTPRATSRNSRNKPSFLLGDSTGPGRVWIQTHKKRLATNDKGQVAQEANPLVCIAVLGCFLIAFLAIIALIGVGLVFGAGAEGGAAARASNIHWGGEL